ncbi:MAG: DUF5916 domain-containing protein [Cyclobacteriaceae bacterium]
MKIILQALLILLLSTCSILAQDTFQPPVDLPHVDAQVVKGEIKIDGILKEGDWESAKPITNFTQIEPWQGEASRYPSVVRILFSSKYLYVGVFCKDTLGRGAIRVPDMMRDFNWRAHDTFAIAFDGFNDHRNSITFATNPYGVQKDYLSFDDIFFDSDWNGLWKVRTSITAEGWYAEFQIPWKTLRYSKPSGNVSPIWNINFLRLRRATNEISAWSAYPRSFGFNRMEYAGVLNQLAPPKPGTNVQFNPYTMVSGNQTYDGSGEKFESTGVKAGGELKWTMNSNTTLDFTVNTDFAQADADIQVNNVSRFSILFPEKRQFFLENSSLFSPSIVSGKTGGNMQFLPFFSRRVGLSSVGRPLPVEEGLRLVSRNAKQSIGVMALHQGSVDTLPNANIFVGRYSKNFGSKVRLGSMATYKSEANGNVNALGSLDGFIRFDAAQSLNFLVAGSTTENSNSGIGGYAQYFYTSNKFTAWWTESLISEGFDPALGFISRSNVIGTTPGITANLRGNGLPFSNIIRSYQPGVSANIFHQASTRNMTESEIKVTPFWIEMQDGGYYGFSTNIITQDLLSDFMPLGLTIPKGRYNYQRYTLDAGFDPSRKLSYTFQHGFGDYYDGKLTTTNLSISLVPIPHISIKGSVNINRFKAVGAEQGEKEVTLYTLQTRFAINPRVQLISLYQRSNTNLESYNIRLAWEFQPLSYFYLVLNSRETLHGNLEAREQQGIVKLSFLKQF